MTLFRKANVADSSYEHWLQAMLCTKACPGYKQVMMHKNYLTFVPQEYNTDELYCKPSNEMSKAEEEDQKQRKQYKKMSKDEKLKVG